MTTLAFVGNCQVSGLQAAARAMLPDLNVRSFHVGVRMTASEVRDAIEGTDRVVTMFAEGMPQAAVLGTAQLGPRAVYLPPFTFPALHADIVSVGSRASPVPAAVGSYHSLIALAAFELDLPVERVLDLYNARVFAALRYFEGVDAAWPALLQRYAAHGYDLRPHLPVWRAANGPFMHAANHPAITVLSSLATLVLERLGLVGAGSTPPLGVEDGLFRAVVQPVYPEIAHRAGCPSQQAFLRRSGSGADRTVPMAEFVERSYGLYRKLGIGVFASSRTAATTATIAQLLARATYPTPARMLASASAM